MDVRRLDLLRELRDRGSVIAVARATHRTPSAVSQQLKVLEREIGFPLTERRGRGIILTEAGKALARTAADIAVAIERAEALWHEYVDAPVGEVSLATFPTGGQMLLPGVLREAVRTPGLVVSACDRDPAIPDFPSLTNDFDIVLAHSLEGPRAWRGHGLAVEELMAEPLDIALSVGHPLTAKAVLTPDDLVGETWIGVPPGFPFQQVLSEIEQLTGEAPLIAHRFSDTRVTESLVAADLGIAILPRYTTARAHPQVEIRPLAGVGVERHICTLVRPDRAERPSVRLVLELLRREAALVTAR